jgi:hypothetical protein
MVRPVPATPSSVGLPSVAPCRFTNSVCPSGLKHAPANSELLIWLSAKSKIWPCGESPRVHWEQADVAGAALTLVFRGDVLPDVPARHRAAPVGAVGERRHPVVRERRRLAVAHRVSRGAERPELETFGKEKDSLVVDQRTVSAVAESRIAVAGELRADDVAGRALVRARGRTAHWSRPCTRRASSLDGGAR